LRIIGAPVIILQRLPRNPLNRPVFLLIDAGGRANLPTLKPPAPDERALIELAKRDPETFGLLYERYVGKIYSYIYYRTGNEHDAEDLTARVFVRALKRLSTYTDRGLPFSAWLYRIAHNLVANWHRDQSRRKVVPLDETLVNGLQSEAPEYAAENRQEEEFLLETIRRLPAERQQVLVLKFIEHMSNAEIGAVLNRSEGAIKSLYHRTLLSLREDIEKQTGRRWPPLSGE
jgi:RNA polymerase sigma-70 factor (ECF subfamily)